jgi:4-amino-4-deoxy-L-arabinose transferase-like glycosyltransferase
MAFSGGPVRQSPNRRELKRLLLILVASVAVLDAVVIGLYYAAHIPDRPVKTQQTFVAVWVVLTLIVVTTLMKRIRQARRGR